MKTLSKHWTLFSLFILLLSAGWMIFTTRNAPQGTQGRIPAPQPGFLAPDLSLATLDGGSMRLSDLRGKPVLLNFWASWCAPCKAEMPAMQRVFTEYQDAGLTILAVNATHQDTLAAASAFVAERGLTFPILTDVDGSTGALYQVRALPTTFFIDADGNIVDMIIGGPMSEALLRAEIQDLLDEAP